MLSRTTSFFACLLKSLSQPCYTDNEDLLQKVILLDYKKWMSVIIEQVLQLVHYSPSSDSLPMEAQPCAAALVNSDPEYSNAVILSLVNDGYFEMESFTKLVDYCQRNRTVLKESRLRDFEHLVTRIKSYQQYYDNLNDQLEDCPEEFVDNLMFTIMVNPIRLTNDAWVDLISIERAKQGNDLINPYTRERMEEEELKVDTELQKQIMTYLKKKKEELSAGGS